MIIINNIVGPCLLDFWEQDPLISFLIFQGKLELTMTLSRLRELSVGAAQAVHTCARLKGVVVHDDSLLRLRKKNLPYEGE